MFSLNVPLPGSILRLVEDLRPALSRFEAVREIPTLVIKRFGRLPPDAIESVESEVRLALSGAPAFEIRVAELEAFEHPVSGPAPVLYLAVDSPGIERLHDQLVEAFDPIPGLEGDDYVPHITLARGGEPTGLDGLLDRRITPVDWVVSELWFWDARRGERAGRISLPT